MGKFVRKTILPSNSVSIRHESLVNKFKLVGLFGHNFAVRGRAWLIKVLTREACVHHLAQLDYAFWLQSDDVVDMS